MIVDRIENHSRYQGLGQRISQALRYLEQTDFSQLESGEYLLEGRELFAIVSEYALKPVAAGRLEAHRKYLDIQYLVRGGETIGYAPLCGQSACVAYDAEADVAFYPGAASLIRVEPGMFAIFYPEDLHMPGLGEPDVRVKKVVLKLRV